MLPVQNFLAQNGLQALNGKTESEADLLNFKDHAARYFKAYCDKNNMQGKDLPDNWQSMLKGWCVLDGPAYHAVARKDLTSFNVFFDQAIARVKKVNTTYDASWRDLLLKLAKPLPMDAHYNALREYYEDFYKKNILPASITQIHQILNFADPDHSKATDDEPTKKLGILASHKLFTNKQTAEASKEVVSYIGEWRRRKVTELANVNMNLYVDKSICAVMMGMVSADPQLFGYLDANQIPTQANASQLCDWIRDKILDNRIFGDEGALISLKLDGSNPLTLRAKIKPPTVVAPSATPRQPNPARQQPPQPAYQPPGGAKRTYQQAQPYGQRGGPQPQQTALKKTKTTNPALRHCAFCAKKYPKSNSVNNHNTVDCRRDPTSASYDAIFAAKPPTN